MSAEGAEMSADPVNLSTGNFVYDHEDLNIGGEIEVSFHRYYNSKDNRIGVLGKCFLHNYEVAVEEANDGSVGVRLEDGQLHHFEKTPEGLYLAQNIAVGELRKEENEFILIKNEKNKLRFNLDGKLIRQEDSNGRGISFTYNQKKQLIEAKADNESTLKYFYDDESGYLINVEDHTGRRITMSYEGALLNRVELASGGVYSYRYGVNGNLISETDVLGNTTKYTYTKSGALKDTIYPNGTGIYRCYKDGRVSEVTRTDGNFIKYEYDACGNIIAVTSAISGHVTYEYDALNRMTSMVIPGGGIRRYKYNAAGKMTSYIDENNNETKYEYTPNGLLKKVEDALGNVSSYKYDCVGNLMELVK